MPKKKYYSIDNMMKQKAVYSMIIGQRSNGKTFKIKEIALFGYHKNGIEVNGYLDDGGQMALIRRWYDDFRGGKAPIMYDDFINNPDLGNVLDKRTKGKWNSIYYQSGKWYLQHIDKDGKVDRKDPNFFTIAFSLTGEEHYKSTSFPMVRFIFFDEFLTRQYYLPDEFIKFQNVVSTIVRKRTDVRIFMAGNTVNKYCPYFDEMGLTNIKNQKQGTIDLYKYGNSDLTVAVEYCEDVDAGKSKVASRYFAFNNPKLKMITTGEWEIDVYPHLPEKYNPNDIAYIYFIVFDKEILQCEIIHRPGKWFTFIHRKTTPIKEGEKHLIYQQGFSPLPNYKRKITKPSSDLENRIAQFYRDDKVFYQDNTVGETVRNYLLWCASGK